MMINICIGIEINVDRGDEKVLRKEKGKRETRKAIWKERNSS